MKKPTNSSVLIETGFEDEGVKSALTLIGKNGTVHNRQEGIWRAIQSLFEAGFSVMNPAGTKKITSKLLLQILWKVVNKMKVPDFKIYKAGPFALKTKPAEVKADAATREAMEQIVTAGVATVMKEGKFIQCMRDKGGAFYKTALFGDCHVQVGYDEDRSDYPISFRVGSLSDVYMNNAATDIRDAVGGLSADEVVIIYRYTIMQFNQLFPEWEGKVAKGDVPRAYRLRKQLEKTWFQTLYDGEEEIEVAYRIGIDKCMVVFAGPACTVIDRYEGDEEEGEDEAAESPDEESQDVETLKSGKKKPFPYIMDGKPYIPLLHFKFFPSSEGYYNYGIGHMVFDIAIVAAQMDNMAYSHAGDNIWPINFVNTPHKNASKLFNEILKAHEMRAAGGKGYVLSENQAGQGSGVTIESFQTQPITGEWERAFGRLERQIERMGFKLDMPDLGANPNEMSLMAEQEATDAPIKQIIEFNASEFEMAVLFTMDAIKKFVADDDQTPLNSTVDLEIGGQQVPLRGISLGMVAQELRMNKYFVVVNARDGTTPSGVMQQAQITKTMSALQPGTPAWNKLSIKQARLNGQNISEADLQMAAPPQAAPAPEGGPQSVAGQFKANQAQQLQPQ
jgi:hypothetical protein